MNFDFKRCPLIETAVDTPVHYEPSNGHNPVDTVLANYDTRPFNCSEEFLNYRTTVQNEDCITFRGIGFYIGLKLSANLCWNAVGFGGK